MKKAGIIFMGIIGIMAALLAGQAYAGCVYTFGVGSKAIAQGDAFTAQADSVFAVHYNPAGLSQIKTPTLSIGGTYYDAVEKIKEFSITSSAAPGYDFNALGGAPSAFESTGDPLVNPAMGFAMPINDKMTFGIAVYAPYGFHMVWDNNPKSNPGALYAWESKYIREAVSPTLSYKVSEKLSFGAGVSLGRSISDAGKTFPLDIDTGDMTSGYSYLKMEATDDFNYNFNVGVLYRPIEQISLGLTYRSITHTDFEGDVYLESPSEGRRKATTVKMKYDHPQSVQGGIRYFFTKTFSVETDVTWVNWSILEDQIETLSPAVLGQTAFAHDRDWEDTWLWSIGMEWKALENLALRAGYAYDPTPVPNDTWEFGWPDTNRVYYSMGLGWDITQKISLDAAVQHIRSTPIRTISGSTEMNHVYGPIVQAVTTAMPNLPTIPSETVNTTLKAEGILWGGSLTLSYKF